MRIVLVAALIAVGCGKKDRDKAEPTAAAVDLQSVDACVACHPTVVAEYRESMHARSHAAGDPIFAGVRGLRVKKEGAEVALACRRCHTPRLVAQPDREPVPVGCFDCHQALAGAPEGSLLGPNDLAAELTPAHGTGPASPGIADGTGLCMTCHAEMKSPAGLAMCTTGIEHGTVADSGSCSSCHMPQTDGPATVNSTKAVHASHAFLGPHRAWYQNDSSYLATAVELGGSLTAEGLTITVANKSGHDFPTGFPGRLAVVGCVGRDAAGAEVWRCPDQRLGKRYVDADGKPTLAPWAAKIAADTRILAGKTGNYQFEPPAEVASVEVTVSMRLLPPPLAEKIQLTDAVEAEPRRIATATLQRN